MILAVLARALRLPQRRAVQDREVHRSGSSRSPASSSPSSATPTFKWVNALPSILLVARRLRRQPGSSARRSTASAAIRRSRASPSAARLLRGGYTFLWNKYYLDDLYEKVHRPRHRPARSPRRAYWINQHVIDGIVNGAGNGGARHRRMGLPQRRPACGRRGGQRRGHAASGTGGALRPVQSGKVNQYGALLFGAAAIGALVLVIVNT